VKYYVTAMSPTKERATRPGTVEDTSAVNILCISDWNPLVPKIAVKYYVTTKEGPPGIIEDTSAMK
jgi:hypothetical protein